MGIGDKECIVKELERRIKLKILCDDCFVYLADNNGLYVFLLPGWTQTRIKERQE